MTDFDAGGGSRPGGVVGATIAGGGATNYFGTASNVVAGEYGNAIGSNSVNAVIITPGNVPHYRATTRPLDFRAMDLRLAEQNLRGSYREQCTTYRKDDEIEVTTPHHQRLRKVLGELTASFGQPISVLEAGCGTGRYFHCLHNVDRLVGLDISPDMLAAARYASQLGLHHRPRHRPRTYGRTREPHAPVRSDPTGIGSPHAPHPISQIQDPEPALPFPSLDRQPP